MPARNQHPFLAQLQDRGLPVPDTMPAKPTAVPGLPKTSSSDPAALRYARAAMDNECLAVARAGEGTRNDTLNKAAFSLGQLVAGGYLDGELALDRLTDAARSAGLGTYEINQTAPRSLRDGAKDPRVLQLEPRTEPASTTFDVPTRQSEADQADGAVDATAGDEHELMARYVDGGSFIFDSGRPEPPVWGDDRNVLWAAGEALMVVGPPGVGKTTTVQQLVLARVGLLPTFLGYEVRPTTSKVLYLAMDRPRQIGRSMRRMVDEGDRQLLEERLVVWPGPPPRDAAKAPEVLRVLAEMAGADTIIVDSVKDAAVGLTDSDTAGWYNRARQRALAAGVEVVEIAHQKKSGADGKAPKSLADVHGGMELTAGAGSVFLVWGNPGDPIVEFRHLKQPADVVGPLKLVHDHEAGRTTVFERVDAGDVLKASPGKEFTVKEIAEMLSDAVRPSDGEKERVRRKLERLHDEGHVIRSEMDSPHGSSKRSFRYRWAHLSAVDTSWSETS